MLLLKTEPGGRGCRVAKKAIAKAAKSVTNVAAERRDKDCF